MDRILRLMTGSLFNVLIGNGKYSHAHAMTQYVSPKGNQVNFES